MRKINLWGYEATFAELPERLAHQLMQGNPAPLDFWVKHSFDLDVLKSRIIQTYPHGAETLMRHPDWVNEAKR